MQTIYTISLIIFLAGLCAAGCMTLRYAAQMFQQNSYRYSRFWGWYKKNRVFESILPAVLYIAAATVVALFDAHILFFFITGIGFLYYAYKEFTHKYKIPIAYTARIKRMFTTSAVLCAVIFVAAFLMSDNWTLVIGAIPSFAIIILLLANYINTPVEKGINRYYYNDAKKIISSYSDLIIIGITGSYGKTSTKNFLYRILSEKYNVLITPGNFNTTMGVIRTIREYLKPYHQVFIVEMGAKQVGDIKEICDLVHPSIGIVTSVGKMHLETFRTFENIQSTKFELINALPKDGLGVINLSSEGIASYKGDLSGTNILSYSVDGIGDVFTENITYSPLGASFDINFKNGETLCVNTPLLGEGNILNIIGSVAVARYLGVSDQRIQMAVSKLQPIEHRLSMRRTNGLTILDDAYNSNPEGAKMALCVLKQFATTSQKIVITPGFVELGEIQDEACETFGRQIAEVADYAIIVNKLNRAAFVRGLQSKNFPGERMLLTDSLEEAHQKLALIVKPQDVILYENDLPDTFK